MDIIRKIRNRLGKKDKVNLFYRISCSILICISIILGFLIYAKKDEEATFLNENFNINVNFSKMNSWINDLFNFKKTSNNEYFPVANNKIYLPIGKDLYQTDSNEIFMINKGIILGVNQESDASYTLLISYDNGVIASYFNIVTCLVKEYDQLQKGEIIGYYNESFKALFKKGDSLVNYEDAV